jgi:cytidyltransferase-like protein
MTETIVCASGYFDCLHIGHIEYLERSKSLGTKLIVIVNNDKQLVLKKGTSFMPEDERLKIVRSLKCVDSAILSVDEDGTVCKTLSIIHPDIFTNGGDQNNDIIPEKVVCDFIGIKLVDGLGDKIQSSSWLLAKNKKTEFFF